MPTVYSYSRKIEQPVAVHFQCEFCNHEFTVTGKLSALAKTEKWLTERAGEAGAELQHRGNEQLQKAKTLFENEIAFGGFIKNFSHDDTSLKFKERNICPKCGYRQRMATKQRPKTPILAKIVLWLMILAIPVSIISAMYVELINALVKQSFDLSGTILVILALILIPLLLAFAVFSCYKSKNPNYNFMRKHGIKKQDLPEPRPPKITYGQITTS
jgi:hypothetical protein